MAQTGIAPDPAIRSLLALTATGAPEDRIAAARALTTVFGTDATARDRVSPGLVTYAETIAQLSDLDVLLPDEVVREAEALLVANTPGAWASLFD